MPRLVAEQRVGHPVLHQRLAEVGQDERRSVAEAVKHPQQRRGDVRRGRGRGRRAVPRDLEQVVAFVVGQPQRPGQGREHLLARLRAALLLEPRVVVG